MPLPSDQKLLTLRRRGYNRPIRCIFGLHPGFRPVHARGVMLTGSFTPTSEASALSSAPHFNQPSTPVTLRFSSSTGIPSIPDTDPQAQPRGLGLRFHLGEHTHTDIIGHSTPAFPARNGTEFLDFFRAVAGGTVEEFLGAHPAALAFVQTPKPFPASFAHEGYFALHAFKFTNSEGITRFGRYTLIPMRDSNITDDVTVHWPKDRATVNLGKVTLTTVDDQEHQKIIFDPVPRVNGIEESDDPLFAVRAAVYLMSGRRRRAAAGK
ncbi:catalase-like domain-containing protein [Mycena haematopus]|nr:catalase-like domain-containing protein [Mycena haematopus]